MANLVKINSIGKDSVIHKVQSILYDKLTLLWKNVDLTGYPRCYAFDGKINYYTEQNDYKSLIHAEQNKFFFTADEDVEKVNEIDFTHYTTDIELFFIVNVRDIYPNILHLGDEEVRNDVMNILNKISDVSITNVTTNIENVFNGYDYREVTDIHPYHCFRITLKIPYFKINQKNCE